MDGLSAAVIMAERNRLEARIQELNRLINQYKGNIKQLHSQIGNVERSYDSLITFKDKVRISQEEFVSASNQKSSKLEKVNAASMNNTVAKKYYAGMKRLLSGSGSRISNSLYNSLLRAIQIELTSLRNTTNDLYEKINQNNRLINVAQTELSIKQRELQSLQ